MSLLRAFLCSHEVALLHNGETCKVGERLQYLPHVEVCGLVTAQALIQGAFVLGKSPLTSGQLLKIVERCLFKNGVSRNKERAAKSIGVMNEQA